MAYKVENPLGIDSLEGIFSAISGRILEIIIPIAVLLYIWAGVQMLIAAGRPDYIARAKKTFLYVTVGLVVIFIGGGFVSLIRSILNAGESPSSAPAATAGPSSTPLVPLGGACLTWTDCQSGLSCSSMNTCVRGASENAECLQSTDCASGLTCKPGPNEKSFCIRTTP